MKIPVEFELSQPIDGVRPLDHPERYERLLRSICLQPTERCLVETEFPWRRWCRSCYRQRYRLYCTIRDPSAHGYRTQLSPDEHWETITECFKCGKVLMNVCPARNCRKCIEIFLDEEEAVNETLDMNMFSFERF
mgnify:CR=1 FL=1